MLLVETSIPMVVQKDSEYIGLGACPSYFFFWGFRFLNLYELEVTSWMKKTFFYEQFGI